MGRAVLYLLAGIGALAVVVGLIGIAGLTLDYLRWRGRTRPTLADLVDLGDDERVVPLHRDGGRP